MERKRGKKGWMKIFEASIAITLVMGFMVLVYSQTIERPPAGESLVRWQTSILDELKNRPDLRQEILNKPETVCDPNQGGLVYGFIFERITKAFPGFGFSCRVCDPGEICGIQQYKKEVYSEEKIIAATLTTFSPKKIKLFVWPLEPDEEVTPIAPQITPPPEADTTAPGNVISFACSGSASFVSSETITCTWTSPTDIDFKEVLVYVNDAYAATISKEQEQKYQKTGITSNVPNLYTIKAYTKDTSGNVNNTGTGKSCSIAKSGNLFKAIC